MPNWRRNWTDRCLSLHPIAWRKPATDTFPWWRSSSFQAQRSSAPAARQAARRAGFDSLYLYTHERMTENIALYTRIGYVQYDRRPLDHGKHLVYLRKTLG